MRTQGGETISSSAPAEALTLYLTALNSLPVGLLLVSREGQIVFSNPRAIQIGGLEGGAVVPSEISSFYQLLSGQTDSPSANARAMTAAAGQPATRSSLQFSTHTASGSRTLSLDWFPYTADGYGLLLRDVTRERELDELKSQLLSTVSHELRTPLASIKGFATTLLREDVHWDTSTQREFLRIIEEETDRLSELIDSLLDMSQIEVGALRVSPEPTQLRAVAREVIDEERMRTERHWFVVDLPSELPRVWADPRRIRQVLRNLIENAVKYAPQGGQITVTCEVGEIEVTTSVSDQGEGIAPQHLDRIFERFFQVDGANTRRSGGSGLGLAIARGIVQAHGGRIWAESAAGQGSTFRFTLPIARDIPGIGE